MKISFPSHWQYPSFKKREFRQKETPYCLAIFVINEGERIRKQLARMKSYLSLVDVIIADGGSSDGSLEEGFLKTTGIRTLLTKTGPGKLSAQMRMAFAYALDEKYAGVIVVDGNNKDDPEAIPRFLDALEKDFDHVQGSRYIPGGKEENTPFLRLWGVRLLHAPLLSLASGYHYTDTTNGFRAYSARFLSDQKVATFRDIFVGYELHYYLAIRAARLGFKVTEVPTTRIYPKNHVPSKISSLTGNIVVIATLFKAVLGYYDPR